MNVESLRPKAALERARLLNHLEVFADTVCTPSERTPDGPVDSGRDSDGRAVLDDRDVVISTPSERDDEMSDERTTAAQTAAWRQRVQEVVDHAHFENFGGKHRIGFCAACSDAYIVAQHAVPTDYEDDPDKEDA